jgi:thioester reductase-like protein
LSSNKVLLTGFPSFTARRMCRLLVADGDEVTMLVRHRHKDAADRFIADLEGPGHVNPAIGDVVLMDLGLSGPEVRKLLRDVEIIYHLASIPPRSHRAQQLQQINVDGTRSIVELALGADRLKRFVFLSTAFVSGDRRGVVLEEELERGQSFRTSFERTKYEAERKVRRASADMPVSIFRPSLVVGDTRTGQFDTKDDPYHMMLAFLNVPFDIPIPLPGRGDYPLHLVPVDYVVRAMAHISRDPRGVGRTFHLTDPNPLPAARVLDLIADAANRKRPRGSIPAGVAKRLLKIPGLSNRAGAPPSSVVDWFNQLVIYNTTNTLELLSGTDLRCPPFESYVANLVSHLRSVARQVGPGEEFEIDGSF